MDRQSAESGPFAGDYAMMQAVVPGRECGACNACCIHLTIEDKELLKPQGYRCKHLSEGTNCSIYETRPQTCREFNCGWRLLKWVKPTMRPDQSGVLIRFQGDREHRLGVSFLLLRPSALKAEGLAESMAAAVAANVPVYVSIPGPPGYTASLARIDHALAAAVATRDKAAILKILQKAMRQGSGGKRAPIRFEKVAAPEA